MGDQDVDSSALAGEKLRNFMQSVLNDLHALETMIDQGLIERGCRRIGAELEMFLVDDNWQPAPAALAVLDQLDDPRFTTELAQFNLEANLDPLVFEKGCLRAMEEQLNTLAAKARTAAAAVGTRVVFTGILPTIRKSDLGLENITPRERYYALNKALTSLRGDDYQFRIQGMDELMVTHDSVMVESCNSSFQAHFQLSAEEFPRLYNIAQAIAGPSLAAMTNSPLLFGRRLWSETRIALFEQAVDTRRSRDDMRQLMPRVTFGSHWVKESVLELYREDIARFRALLGSGYEEDSVAVLARGEIPRLRALSLHNGTVYRWNRACYGITDGKPHLRIENRVIPSGPSTLDSVSNGAFWYGLMSGMAEAYRDVTTHIAFDEARDNFHAAATKGIDAQFHWFDEGPRSARELLIHTLIPLAKRGLEGGGIDSRDIDRYIGVIEHRVESRQTGSVWLMRSWDSMRDRGSEAERLAALTAGLCARQHQGKPVSRWDLADLNEAGGWARTFARVDQVMATDLFTVQADESVDLVANLMDWNRIRHVMVEDAENHLVGLVSYRSLLRVLARGGGHSEPSKSVADIMVKDPISVAPDTSTLDATNLMRQHRVGCLPVVDRGRLVGVITERQFLDITAELLEERLRENESGA